MKPRPFMLSGWLSLSAALPITSGCEQGITLHATVTVPAAVTQALSEAQPGVVILGDTGPENILFYSYRLAVLCAPLAEDLTLVWDYDHFGCASESTITAGLHTADAAAVAAECGIATTENDGLPDSVLVAEGRARVFSGRKASQPCRSGKQALEIVLAPVGQ